MFSIKLRIIIIIITFITSTNRGYSNNLLKPYISNNCKEGECVKDQFKGAYLNKKRYYFAIVSEEINLMERPIKKSNIISRFNPTDSVIVLHNFINANNESWYYIKTTTSLKGWLPSGSIIFKSMFKPDYSWKNVKVEFNIGDEFYYLKFMNNSKYRGYGIDTYPSHSSKKNRISGTIYRYKDILYMKDSSPQKYDFFVYICDYSKNAYCSFKIKNK